MRARKEKKQADVEAEDFMASSGSQAKRKVISRATPDALFILFVACTAQVLVSQVP